jgi:hypothetical protein
VSTADLDRAEAAIPKGSQQEILIRTIEHYAATNGVLLKLVSFELSTKAGAREGGGDSSIPRPGGSLEIISNSPKKELGIRFAVSGTYQSVKKFIDDLERHIRIIDVHTIDFIGPDSPAKIINVSLSATTYYQ